ncbi:MAG: preprotein translocase subunit SecE [Bacilli bacterium]
MKKIAKKVVRFFISIKQEMKKVKWPTKKEMITYSSAALIFIIGFAAFFSLTDLLITGIRILKDMYL